MSAGWTTTGASTGGGDPVPGRPDRHTRHAPQATRTPNATSPRPTSHWPPERRRPDGTTTTGTRSGGTIVPSRLPAALADAGRNSPQRGQVVRSVDAGWPKRALQNGQVSVADIDISEGQ